MAESSHAEIEALMHCSRNTLGYLRDVNSTVGLQRFVDVVNKKW